MDLRQLRALVAIARTRSVTRAAEALHLVQPAVSRQLQVLEEDLGVQLFERSRDGMALTPPGHVLLERAENILRDVAIAEEAVRSSAKALAGRVTVGLLASTAEVLGPALARSMSRACPQVQVRFVVGYAGHLHRWMLGGEIDAALLYESSLVTGVRLERLLSEPLWVVGPASGALHAGEAIRVECLAGQPMVLPTASHGLRSAIEAVCEATGVRLTCAFETNDLALQKRLVREGHGLTILPAVAVRRDVQLGSLTAAPLGEPPVCRTVALALPAARIPNRVVQRTTELLLEALRTTVAAGEWSGSTWMGCGEVTE